MQRSITMDDNPTLTDLDTITVLDDISADVFALDFRAVPVHDMSGSNTTSQCTDNGCSRNCASVGCTRGCSNGCPTKGCPK